jgi:hypothetical protein
MLEAQDSSAKLCDLIGGKDLRQGHAHLVCSGGVALAAQQRDLLQVMEGHAEPIG